jgi:four helix bundle protein
MGARNFRELDAWQLADHLSAKIDAVLAASDLRGHFKFCENLEDAADSVPSNIAEGFRRYNPREFARFLEYSLSSLGEISSKLEKMRRIRLGTPQDHEEISFLIARCTIATARLRRSQLRRRNR